MIRLAERGIQAVLLDIEGTTTPLAFVHEVLVPYARAHLAGWLDRAAGTPVLSALTRRFAEEHTADRRTGEKVPPWAPDEPDDGRASLEAYAGWLMDCDRKSPALKALQGLMWEQGYQAGALRGQVFDDVPVALRRWQQQGRTVAIFSSGSELAQRRLFESTSAGDLTPAISRYFDTAIGPKRDPASYARIADALRLEPRGILFVSDVVDELSAAEAAGQHTVLCRRPGNPPQAGSERFTIVRTFDEIDA